METRLDRLFTLLDTGSTAVIRKSASTQLGEIQKLYPHKLKYLLNKILVLMRSKTWETRIAAGMAVEAIAKNVIIKPEYSVDVHIKQPKVEPLEQPAPPNNIRPLTKFDVTTILREGSSLFSGDVNDYSAALAGIDDKELIQQQKMVLNKKLGLEGPISDGLQLFDDSDLITSNEAASVTASTSQTKQAQDLLLSQMVTENMSARELSVAKRIAKQQLKRQMSSGYTSTSTPNEKRVKKSNVAVDQPGQPDKVLVDTIQEDEDEEDDGGWPFSEFSEVLCNDLFSIAWETRHGAATLLREVIKQTGFSAGVVSPANALSENQQWLESCAVRLICVLALDRFGDYISDEVVAPVRETCAQTLGSLCQFLPPDSVADIMTKLRELLIHNAWEVRYGALLGLKYIIAVRQDLVDELGNMWPLIVRSIEDEVDDVRAVTATCLLPVVGKLPTVIPDKIDELVQFLWKALLDLDDLTSSTHSMMTLLSALLTAERLRNMSGEPLSTLVPRVWPFLSHNISTVRTAALQMIHTVIVESENLTWLGPILMDSLRFLYQRCLIEPDKSIAELAEKVWTALVTRVPVELLLQYSILDMFNMWICLLMQPIYTPIDPQFLIRASHHRQRSTDELTQEQTEPVQEYISGPIQDRPEVRSEKVLYTRLLCSRCLGQLLAALPLASSEQGEQLLKCVSDLLSYHLRARSGVQRLGAALVLSFWAQYAHEKQAMPDVTVLSHILLQCAEDNSYYDEVAQLIRSLQTECKNFLACLKQQKASLEHIYPQNCFFTIELARKLVVEDFVAVRPQLKKKDQIKFTERSEGLLLTVNQLQSEYSQLHIRVQMSLACALVSLRCFPPKLNPVIRPLMETIKKEPYFYFQNLASTQLCTVLNSCISREPCPNAKVFKNLCTALCALEKQTPLVDKVEYTADDSSDLKCDNQIGIITLFTELKASNVKTKRGPKPKKSASDSDGPSQQSTVEDTETNTAELIQYEGASNALRYVVSTLDEELLNVIPTCREHYITPVISSQSVDNSQVLVNSLQVLHTIFGALSNNLKQEVVDQFSALTRCVTSSSSAVRHLAARAVATCAYYKTGEIMNHILDSVLPLLGASYDTAWRQGSIEVIYHIVDRLSISCTPYIVLMVVPVLGRMTDQDLAVQMMASQCFASLIKLMPLEGGVPDPPEMKKHHIEKKLKEREFLTQLLSGNILQNYGIPIPIKADLRKYQQDGVNWLAFLNKYKLHGILCDDMGLGKTLQAICIMAGDHHNRQKKYEESGDVDSVPLPSLVICPSTLCGHWVYEVQKFVDKEHLHALNYSALPVERIRLREKFKDYSLVVASYEIVRNDLDFLRTISWNYCILDEGHMIKNAKSKTTQAVKKLNCNHRLILSGTPVQNNVLELWSLFDFLMPGYLGSERQFSVKYSRPILQSRDVRSSSKEQEAGALAVESLHKQVLPFMLRRLKTDVLQDLPPKIIQDYYCELSPLQHQLYREFGESSAGHFVEQTLTTMDDDGSEKIGVKEHIFQALQYLKKVCNHPALVLHNSKHPKHEQMMKECKAQGKSITDIEYSAKLTALKQLLLDCGIGVTVRQSEPVDGVVNQHRALIFCQLKMMIDIIENQLLKKVLPTVTYLRLDGSTPTNSRYDLVNRFNDDPSIDVLLLTTTVGGLGLNLTGADTVIFVEHDWNPMKDLQAMDRAHRIGQKKVVNVYRLITRETLEEKIMGLQKFKLNIANTIVNQENSGLASMATDQLLDLFSVEVHHGESSSQKSNNMNPSKGLKAMLQDMTALWDESEYETEYNVTNFLASLGKK